MTSFLAGLCILLGLVGFIFAVAAAVTFLNIWLDEADFGLAVFAGGILAIIAAFLLWGSNATYPYLKEDNARNTKAHNELVLERREICKTKFTEPAELSACMVDTGTLDVSAL